ncbi:VOC family protein [uncultured Paraglaciecola sp.]|uniref:VOC family protein n=1 Tax=uncultured Paraglaciecola sp. TaxID=1765024 RepID=UPI0030D766BD|tara:strand:- start:9144 stop:9479 length:336 start_codon:yes stop_codon:yes gene_type:complete
MELGQFSVSLTVKDIKKSKVFYETLGFKALPECGSINDKWLILQKGTTVIGLFEGMFESNILTFNPTDVRSIEKHLQENGMVIETATKGESGPAHCVLKDPDGNVIMFDQF